MMMEGARSDRRTPCFMRTPSNPSRPRTDDDERYEATIPLRRDTYQRVQVLLCGNRAPPPRISRKCVCVCLCCSSRYSAVIRYSLSLLSIFLCPGTSEETYTDTDTHKIRRERRWEREAAEQHITRGGRVEGEHEEEAGEGHVGSPACR